MNLSDNKNSNFFISSVHDLEKNELEAVFASLGNLLMMLDRNGTYLKITHEHPQLYKPAEYRIGKKLYDILPFETADRIHKKIIEALTFNRSVKVEYFLPIDGQKKCFLANIIPVSSDKVVLIRTDVTEMKLLEEELIKQKEKAEEMNKLKSYFLANMSHELRTPMIGILGFSEMLSSELADEDMRDKARIIYDSGKRLMETLNLILDLAKIESNLSEINLSDFDIISIIKSRISSLKPLAHSKGLFIELVTGSENIMVRLDKYMFTQIIKNLLSNAVKYTLSGGITVKVHIEENDTGGSDQQRLCIQVSDSGIGIPPEQQEKIFEPFRQASEGIGRSYEGIGLGLTLVKKYVDLLKGEISFLSQVGTGTIFKLRFSLRERGCSGNDETGAASSEVINPVVNNSGSLPNILFVEDDAINQTVIKMFLKNICETDIANCSDAALKMVTQKKYDLILMDINLGGGKTGIETAQIIRQMPGYENVPIVAVTAYASSGEKEYFLNNGCDYYIAKPFTRKEVVDLVTKMLCLA